jgi:Bacterial Ig domain
MGKMASRLSRATAAVAGVATLVGLVIALQGSASAVNPGPIALPDMRIFVPTNLISIGMNSSTGHRELRFTHKTADIGAGPFEIDPHYNSRTGVSTFTQRIYREPSSGVWVADHSIPLAVTGTWEPPSDYRFPLTRFTLNKMNPDGSPGATVAVSPKVDYCITGDTQIQGVPNEPNQTAIPVSDCTDPTKPLGWSVGWADQYDQTDAGQPIDLSGLPPDGTYVLRAIVDPYNVLQERTTANDVTDTTLRITGTQVTVLGQHVVNVPLPKVRITSPAAGTSAWGGITIQASVSAPAHTTVGSVQFLLDGQPIGPALTKPPYSLPWNLHGVSPGRHYLSARVTDSEGIVGSAPPTAISVTRGPAVAIKSLRWQGGFLTLVLSHRPAGDSVVAVISTSSGQRKVAVPGYRLRVRSPQPKALTLEVVNSSGKVVGSLPVPLNARPSVRIVNPSAGQTVFGIARVAAQASDAVGVSSVSFSVDGRRLGPGIVRAPYSLAWDTRKVKGGTHTLSAEVVDALGHTTTTRISVVVHNPQPPMTCFVLQRHVSGRGNGVVSTPAFRTVVGSETLLAFVSADGPSGGAQRAVLTGGGVHWQLVARADGSPGDAEVWQAIASKPMNVSAIKATLSDAGYDVNLNVIAMEGADGTAATAVGSGASGAPSVKLTTESATSLVFAVGHDWDQATARKLPVGWVMLDQWLDTGAGDTFWTQYTNQPTGPVGSHVTVSDLAPKNDHWNLAAVELINSD